jgi:hypothetical protein
MNTVRSPHMEDVLGTIDQIGIRAVTRSVRQLNPYRRVGLESSLKELEARRTYEELEAFVVQEAGALGLTLAELNKTETFLP